MMRALVALVMAAALALGAVGAAQASVVELHLARTVLVSSAHINPIKFRDVMALTTLPVAGAMTPPTAASMSTSTPMSTLPEPEVLAMMLLGLCLIGYRVGHINSEKFK